MLAYGLYTSIALLGVIVTGTVLFEREFSKHERPEAYDDRLTDQRMREATEDMIRRWTNGKKMANKTRHGRFSRLVRLVRHATV
jgi:hypothetical protein